jgi:MYXO-CTERM domain-containing protein
MRSINTLLGTVVLGASIALAAPAAHAAAALPQTSAECTKAVAAADTAQADYDAALADYKKTVAAGGHPGKAERENLAMLENNVNITASDASRMCPDAKVPSGTMHTGVGSTSEGVNSTEIAAGAALLGVAGAGALVLRRRRNGSQV